MLFNSLEFAIFLPLVFGVYWFIFNKKNHLQNTWLLAASYFFYGWWDWRFLGLIAFSSLIDYFIGWQLGKAEATKQRKLLLGISLFVNLGFLGFFKYYNFFAENFAEAFTLLGTSFDPARLSLILPVGISFYTFQTLSYSIDVYRKKIEPSNNLIAFLAFVSFFPQLVAGPIERASNLLPQFFKTRTFNFLQARDGMRQILWGLFKKMVIADNCAMYVDPVFANYMDHSGGTLFIAAILFAFQIYGDFSGYSDIAIGTARLFGFDLKQNFAFPYFSRDIAEFWRRWHISLSTWFRDYLYIPLGGSRGGRYQRIRNTFIIFLVSGFWHGANWTFVIWGFLNACYFLPLLLLNKNRVNLGTVGEHSHLPSLYEFLQILFTFFLTVLAWVFFRAVTVEDACNYLILMFGSMNLALSKSVPMVVLCGLMGLIIVEWFQRRKQHGLEDLELVFPKLIRWGFYLGLMFIIVAFDGRQKEFVYFQF